MSQKENGNDLPTTVEQKNDYVEIIFSEQLPRNIIEKQVQECQTGKCECYTPAFRNQVKSFEILTDQELKVRVRGDISRDQAR